MVIDTAVSPIVQQPLSRNLPSTHLAINASGAIWTISPGGAPASCLDAGTGASGSRISVKPCRGTLSQHWRIVPHGHSYGAFTLQNLAGGNDLNVVNPSTSTAQKQPGVPFDVEPYAGWSSQQFRIQAIQTVD